MEMDAWKKASIREEFPLFFRLLLVEKNIFIHL